MIHPQLRAAACLIRAVWPSFSEGKFRMCNKLLDIFYKGRRFSRKMRYEQTTVRRPDGSELRLCVYSPLSRSEGAPSLLWLHGGGYAIGLPEQDTAFIERFVETTGCVVAAPDYRRSLDVPYPAALDDCALALRWLRDNCTRYGGRRDQLFVGGDSAGGGLTAALSLLERDRGEVAIAFQMPLYPMLDDRMITPSSVENDAPVWNTASNEVAWRCYLGGKYETGDVPKYAAPAREKDCSRLPPTLTYVGDIEPFHDETVGYVHRLEEAGVEVSFMEFAGCFHAFDVVCPRSEPGKRAARFLTDGFARAAERCFAPQPHDK